MAANSNVPASNPRRAAQVEPFLSDREFLMHCAARVLDGGSATATTAQGLQRLGVDVARLGRLLIGRSGTVHAGVFELRQFDVDGQTPGNFGLLVRRLGPGLGSAPSAA